MTTTDFLTRYGADKNGMAHCPTHDDKKRSLHISPGRNGDTVLFDHGGCEVPDILAAKGLELSDLFSESKTSGAGRVVETTYDYRDEDGKLLFQAVRYNPKGFSQRRPDGGGDWIWKLDGVRRVPYRLPELIAADRNDPVFLPEGEKDVERLRDGGLVATCNSGGAGTGKNNFNWRAEYNESLRGRPVVILADNDDQGRKHAQAKARSLHGVASSVKVLYFPELPDKGDVSNWLDAGHTIEELHKLAEVAPEWRPEAGEKAAAGGAEEKVEAAGESLSHKLIKLALNDSELFHDAGGDCYASVAVASHRETYRIGSRAHKDWLSRLLYEKADCAARSETLNEVVTVLRAKALYDGPKIEAHVRIAEHDGAVYLDLCNDKWEQVKIAEKGWEVIASAKSPVRFVRAKGMLPLPEPQAGGSVDSLRDLLNLPEDDKDNWPLIAGWLAAAFKPCNGDGFDYPLLAIHGEQGSGKSTAQRLLRDLIDPNKATLRAAPRDERDLAIAAAHGRVISCDNLTNINEGLSNAFCRLATGGGFATRELFSDDGEVIFDAQRPVILNGIAEVIIKSDLLDRAILVYLPTIPKGKRWKKRVLNRKFTDAQPLILGALCDAVSAGLERMGEGVEMDEWPRMSDFAEWAIACETALGFKAGAFIEAYKRNIGRADDLAIEASPLAQEVIALLEAEPDHVWNGTTGELFKALNRRLESREENPKKVQGWPQSARGLGARLKELAPNLRGLGLDVRFEARGKNGYRLKLVYIKPETDKPQPETTPSAPEVPNDVHQVHQVHRANELNDLGGEHVGEHVGNGKAPNVHPTGAGPAGGERLNGELFGNVHPNVHPVNAYKQKPNAHGEHGERYPEASVDGAVGAEPSTDRRRKVSI